MEPIIQELSDWIDKAPEREFELREKIKTILEEHYKEMSEQFISSLDRIASVRDVR